MDGVASLVVENQVTELSTEFLGGGLHLSELGAVDLKNNPRHLRFEGGHGFLDWKTGIFAELVDFSGGEGSDHSMLDGETV